MRGEDREVLRRIVDDDRGRRDGGGLEAGGEEDDVLVRMLPRDLDGLRGAVDDVDLSGGVRERPHRAGDFEHVAVRGDANAVLGEDHAFVDLGHVGHADGAARPHDHVERFREERAEAELGDGLLVAAADVHHRDGARDLVHEPLQRRGERPGHGRIAKIERGHPTPASISPRTSAAMASSSASFMRIS